MGMFERELVKRFAHCYTSPGGEVWVQRDDAASAIGVAEEMQLPLLGMEGFIVGASGVYPAMSRIADFASLSTAEAYERGRFLVAHEWAEPPADVHSEADGDYMIDLVVADERA